MSFVNGAGKSRARYTRPALLGYMRRVGVSTSCGNAAQVKRNMRITQRMYDCMLGGTFSPFDGINVKMCGKTWWTEA